jgi:selenocysteine lyase/cysteine desulfurase
LFAGEFERDEGVVWLNTAHQGRLPRRAAAALADAVRWKSHPHLLAEANAFVEVPARLRHGLGTLVGASSDDEIVLANSASYGLHLVAEGLDVRDGDEVIVPANDFPSDVLPWMLQRRRGVEVRLVAPRDQVLTADEVSAAIGPRTRALCCTWVHSFSGRVTDLEAVGAVCHERGVWFVVNGSQAVGVRPVDVRALPVDALVSVGFKWLCGPYGTGVAWLRPSLRAVLRPPKLYWLTALTMEDLAAPSIDFDAVTADRPGGLDVFGTANFFNFVPWTAAVELMLGIGVERVAAVVDELVLRLLDGLDRSRYRPVSSPETRSSLVVIEPFGEPAEVVFRRLTEAGVHVAHRRGWIRVSPHLYNTADDVDRVLDLL